MQVEEMEAPGDSFSYPSCLSVFILLGTLLISFPFPGPWGCDSKFQQFPNFPDLSIKCAMV